MARADGRVQPGQRLDTAFSARAWNRAQDAADVVLERFDAQAANAQAAISLPCQQGIFRLFVPSGENRGYYGHAAIVIPFSSGQADSSLIRQPTTPVTSQVAAALDSSEKALPSFVQGARITLTTAQPVIEGLNESPIVICSRPPNVWTYSGLAYTRVRVFSYRHKFARRPVVCGLNDDSVVGCLDSCAFSDVRIIGYVATNGNTIEDVASASLVFPNHQYRWALVSL